MTDEYVAMKQFIENKFVTRNTTLYSSDWKNIDLITIALEIVKRGSYESFSKDLEGYSELIDNSAIRESDRVSVKMNMLKLKEIFDK